MSNPQNHQHSNPSEFNTDQPPVPLGSLSHGFRESGQALFLLLALIIALAFGFVFEFSRSSALAIEHDKQTAAALAQVKDALIGWSVQRTSSGVLPNARPGELPCPDMDNDGFEDGSCVAGAIGRVPWKTLGIAEPKDAAGETLWYAIAGEFRIWNMNGTPINSDTKGSLTVYQDSTASTITTEAVAVIFAPGAALGAQNRDPVATSLCPTTGTTIARNLCAANYLETTAGVNNSTTNGPFISAPNSNTFNDKVMAITTAALIPIVEQRVARELRALLMSYKAAVGAYPWADCSDGTSDVTPSPSTNVDGSNRGRIPWQTAYPVNWGSGGAPNLPAWYVNNNWSWVIYYSAGKNYLEGAGARCDTCVDPTLTVNGVSGKQVVIITTGPAGVSRPGGGDIVGPWGQVNWAPGTCNPVGPTWEAWQAYLDDPENYDLSNDLYVTPSSTAYARDRLYTIP